VIEVVKGISRRVIVIKSPDKHLFDEAIFIVREDALREGGVSGDEIIKQAQEVAGSYVRYHLKRRFLPNLPAPAFAAVGAACTALVWFFSQYVF
jgi:hypothetical protein